MTDSNDPLGAFSRLFEQFDASGPASVPPALGFPLSPFPMPGASGATFSPEESTKRTVRQLYSALAGLSGSGSESTLFDAWQQYADVFDMDTSMANAPEQVGAATMNTYRVWFYSLAQILVESYTLRLVHDELVVDDHRRSTDTQQWLWGLSQADREQLLLRCTDVDDDLVAAMETARKRRNELLYDFGSWRETDFEASLSDARQYLRVLTALDDRVTPESTFSFFPPGVSHSQEDGGDAGDAADVDPETDGTEANGEDGN